MDLVAGSLWFSSLELCSRYWQVPLTPESRAKTAFSTSRGHWQFKVLSFGCCNAPGTVERPVDNVLANIHHEECLVYLDDVLIHGRSFRAALDSLMLVLARIATAGLKLHQKSSNSCTEDHAPPWRWSYWTIRWTMGVSAHWKRKSMPSETGHSPRTRSSSKVSWSQPPIRGLWETFAAYVHLCPTFNRTISVLWGSQIIRRYFPSSSRSSWMLPSSLLRTRPCLLCWI